MAVGHNWLSTKSHSNQYVTHCCCTVCLSVCSDCLAMSVVLLPSFLLPLLFGFLPVCCSHIQTARSCCMSKSIFFLCFVLPLGWVVGDEWIMNLKGCGWKHMCPNVVICYTGRARRVRCYEGQHAWTCARWHQSWYSGEICSCQQTVVQRGGSFSIVLFIHMTTLCTC